jgi:hypothetical protein
VATGVKMAASRMGCTAGPDVVGATEFCTAGAGEGDGAGARAGEGFATASVSINFA